MWPMPRAPISATRYRVCSSIRLTVSGTPSSLLRLPAGATVGPAVSSTWLSRSLVEVLPCEPVMPTTRSPPAVARSTRCRANRPSATSGSATTRHRASGTGRRVSAAAAPAAYAVGTKSWPSARAPGSATNSAPGVMVRLSAVTEVTGAARVARPGQVGPQHGGHLGDRQGDHRVPLPLAPRPTRRRPPRVAEREHGSAHLLAELVALAEHRDDVARSRPLQREPDGRAAVAAIDAPRSSRWRPGPRPAPRRGSRRGPRCGGCRRSPPRGRRARPPRRPSAAASPGPGRRRSRVRRSAAAVPTASRAAVTACGVWAKST